MQVHPDDDYAKMKEHGQLGKTEMWYVLDAARDAKLIYGLRQDCTKKEMQKALAEGTVMKYLQKVPIHKDDLFFIPAGTIHAIGAGALVAEIQESSNLTYRLYDYDRIGKDGKKRELHIDKALDVADLQCQYLACPDAGTDRIFCDSLSAYFCRCHGDSFPQSRQIQWLQGLWC